jgi:hypothetical protein
MCNGEDDFDGIATVQACYNDGGVEDYDFDDKEDFCKECYRDTVLPLIRILTGKRPFKQDVGFLYRLIGQYYGHIGKFRVLYKRDYDDTFTAIATRLMDVKLLLDKLPKLKE